MEDIISKLVDVALRTDDSADTVCVPRKFLLNIIEKIDNQMEMMADLEVRLLNEMKMRENRIADLIKSSKTSQPCSSAESIGTKPSKRKCARVTKDNKPSVNWGDDDFSSEEEESVLFIPSLVRVRRPCRGLEKFFPPVLQRCYGCSFHAQEIVHTGHGMLGYNCFFLFFFWRERCLPKVS